MTNTVAPETADQKINNLTDGHDDPNRGPLDRAANALDGRDDPNRGPLDRAENALDGRDDPSRGPIDRAENALDGYDDPNRGPLDRTANAVDGYDDPNRGPVDRAENAVDGYDDPNRGPLDRAANAVTGGSGGISAAMDRGDSYAQTNTYIDAGTRTGSGNVISAIFDTKEEAQGAVAELRAAGVSDSALSLIAQSGRTTTTSNADGDVIDEEHTSILRGILGGGALGAGLGIAALAIPGVGPLVAAGAIAASAVPGAMAIGAAAGAALGTLNEALKDHGIDDDDIAYYGDRMTSGGTLVTVDTSIADGEPGEVREILHRNGGHNANRAKVM